jgi:hypothetical protein
MYVTLVKKNTAPLELLSYQVHKGGGGGGGVKK